MSKSSVKPQKLDFLIAGQAIKVRVYQGRAGMPVADFSGLQELDRCQLTPSALSELEAMFAYVGATCSQ